MTMKKEAEKEITRRLAEAVSGWMKDHSPEAELKSLRKLKHQERKLQQLRKDVAEAEARLGDKEKLIDDEVTPKLAELESQISRLERIFRHVMELRERVETQMREKTPEYKELMQMATDWKRDPIKAKVKAKRKAAILANSKRLGRRDPSSPGLQ